MHIEPTTQINIMPDNNSPSATTDTNTTAPPPSEPSKLEKITKITGQLAHFAYNVANFMESLSRTLSEAEAIYTFMSGLLGVCLATRLGNFEWFEKYSEAIDTRANVIRVVHALNFYSHSMRNVIASKNFKGLSMYWTGNSTFKESLNPRFHISRDTNSITGVASTRWASLFDSSSNNLDVNYHKMVKTDPSLVRAWIMNKFNAADSCYISFIKEALSATFVKRNLNKNYITSEMKSRIMIDSAEKFDAWNLGWRQPPKDQVPISGSSHLSDDEPLLLADPTIGGDADRQVVLVPYDQLSEFMTLGGFEESQVYVSRATCFVDFVSDIYNIWSGSISEYHIWTANKPVYLCCSALSFGEISSFMMSAAGLPALSRSRMIFSSGKLISWLALHGHFGNGGLYQTTTMDMRRIIDMIAWHKFRFSHSGSWRRLDWIEGKWLERSVPLAPLWSRLAYSWNIVDLAADHMAVVSDSYVVEDLAWYRGGAIGALTDLGIQVICGHTRNLHLFHNSQSIRQKLILALNVLLNIDYTKKYGVRSIGFLYGIEAAEDERVFDRKVEIDNGLLLWEDPPIVDGDAGDAFYEKALTNMAPIEGKKELPNGFLIMTRAEFSGALGPQFGLLLDFGDIMKIDDTRAFDPYTYTTSKDGHDVSLRNVIWRAISNRTDISFCLRTRNEFLQMEMARSWRGGNGLDVVFEIPHILLSRTVPSVILATSIARNTFVDGDVLIPGRQGSVITQMGMRVSDDPFAEN